MDKRRSFKWFFSVIKTFMPKVVLVVLTFTLATLAGLLPPYLNGILVDHYIKAEEAPLFWGFVSVILAILGSSLLIRFLNIFSSLTVNNLSASVTVRLRELVFGKIQQLSVAGISKKTAGELIQRVNRDTNQANSFISGDLPNIIKQILAFFAIAALFFLYDWRLALLVLLPAALTSLALRKLWRKTHRLYHGQWMANAKASSTLQDIFSGIRVVKAFGAEERETEKYDAVIHEEYRLQVRNETFHAKFHPLLNFFMGIGQYFLLFYAGNQILDGSMTLGEMTRFSAYASMIFEPLNLMTSLPRRLAQVSTSIARIYDVIEDDDVLKDLDEKEITVGGTVEFRNVSFGYDSAREVLHNVSFKAVPGEMIGIVGRSGVGKSTLINLLMRMYDPEEGEILIDGVPLREISQTCLRSQIGAVLQETFLFSGTVYDNIAYAKPGAGREEVIAAARAAGAHKFIIRLTDGYDTYVGEHGYTLSGGERQRIAIARAILHDPRILVLDEATSALDTETEKEIQDALQRLAGSRTTFAIAHRLSTLRNATRILVLDKGRVVQIGSHEELMREKDGIYYGLVMAQRQMSKMPERKAS